jgi:hypothetical protein
MVVFNEASLYRHVRRFLNYYHDSRTHLSVGERCAGATARPAAGSRAYRCDSSTRRSSSSL